MAAVRCDGYALKFIDESMRTYDILHTAVTQNINSMEFIDKQTPEICIAAVSTHLHGILHKIL